MTVRELIEKLNSLPELDKDRVVVLSRDEEGNGFKPLSCAEFCLYLDGEVSIEALTVELKEKGFFEEDILEDGVPALCLWP